MQWAVIHPAETLDDAETFRLRSGGESGVPLAGPGAPLVAEFSVAEFAAAVGIGTEAGKYYLGHALELRYRLPKLWARVVSGELAAWKARQVAHETIGHSLSVEAAAFVDTHVAPVAHRIKPTQLARLVDEAIGRYMPDLAEQRRRDAADGRHFTIDHDHVSFAGTSFVSGELDLADALDLDDAIRSIAGDLADLGCEEPLDVRRSLAAGELARRQLALDLHRAEGGEGAGGFEARPRAASHLNHRPTGTPGRRGGWCSHVHLSQAAIAGTDHADQVGRVENTRTPVTADQIREWCGHPDAQVTVKPVIDLDDHIAVDAYEIPDRIKEAVALRDHACVFPWCTRPARTLRPDQHSADCDHVIPWPRGQTCTCQLAPCAVRTTDSRLTAAGATRPSTPAPTSGHRRTATSTSATTTAPSTSAPTRRR